MAESRTISYASKRPARTWREEVASTLHRFRSRFTRENVISNLKTLAWVVPLTLLIWIYAEREQVATTKDVAVPFDMVSLDPNVAIRVRSPSDQNLILELQGPQARLQDVLFKLRGGLLPQGLKIEVPTSLEKNREHRLDALSLVRNQKIFVDNGVTVLGCQPAGLDVIVDSIVEKQATIVKPPSAKNVDATFDPPEVKVRGPMSMLTAVENQNNGQLLIWADLREDVTKAQPNHYDKEVALRRPPGLDDERITVSGPATVKASVDVRKADKIKLIRSMVITVDGPDSLWNKNAIVWVKPVQPVLQNVTVTGPPETIDMLDQLDQPTARLKVKPQDAGGEVKTRAVQYDLPKGVDVVDDDKNRTVDFRLVDKATLPVNP